MSSLEGSYVDDYDIIEADHIVRTYYENLYTREIPNLKEEIEELTNEYETARTPVSKRSVRKKLDR